MGSNDKYTEHYTNEDIKLVENPDKESCFESTTQYNSLASTMNNEPLNTFSSKPSIPDDISDTQLFSTTVQNISTGFDRNNILSEYVKNVYQQDHYSQCPFTDEEIIQLKSTNEILIYLPANWTAKQLCEHFKIPSNIHFDNEKLISNTMTKEDQWFIVSNIKHPEMLYQTATQAKESYDKEGLWGFDMRRYLAFCGTYKYLYGCFPDNQYWTFLLSGKYDLSGISMVGFDKHQILSHHGWMKNFKAKFCGSRYIVIPPRIEINSETIQLKRAYRGKKGAQGHEAYSC